MRWIINIGKWSIGHGINIKLLPLLGLSSISSAPAVHGSVEPFYVDITEFTKHNPAPLPGRLSMDITEFTKRNPAPLPGRFYMDVTGELRFDPDAPNPQSRDSDYRGKSIDELGERLEFDPHSIDPDYSGKSIDELGEGLEFDRDVFESTDVDLIMRQFDLLRPMFAGDPLMEDPHVPIIELEANLELFNLFRNLSPEERELKLKERCTILCREHAERKQLEANPEMKRNADAQRKAYINWLEGLFELSDEALATKMDEMQAQLHGIDEALASQRDESTSTIPRNRRSIGSQKEKLQAQKTIL
ncbi:MAG: hypothetical protein LBB05_00785, partial [Puniceicoccales bacterium]|nr:hypothetical protein [Puniceicoccales bacterium]